MSGNTEPQSEDEVEDSEEPVGRSSYFFYLFLVLIVTAFSCYDRLTQPVIL